MHKLAGSMLKDVDTTSQQDPFLNLSDDIDEDKTSHMKKLSAMATPFQPRQSSNAAADSVFQRFQNNVSHNVQSDQTFTHHGN